MVRFVLPLAALVPGTWLLFSGHVELGLSLYVVGILGLVSHMRDLRGRKRYVDQQHLAATLVGDVDERIARGETRDQIAAVLAPYGVAPIVLLQLLARHHLQHLGHGVDRQRVAATITWLGSPTAPAVAPEVDLAKLDPRTTLHAMTFGVKRFADDGSGTVWHGALVATRRHLIFVTDLHHESLAKAFVKGFAGGWLPGTVSLANLGREASLLTRDIVEHELSSRRIAGFVESFGHPGSMALAWRQIVAVGKATAPDDNTKVDLLIVVEPDVRRRFRLGTGLKESFAEDWVDLTRTAAALEGVFLPPLS